ncbi:hypothetical protein C5S32_00225 [ANME-1 cluster archaeon GoMg1]|nr:hypothetical protein [ANME-1 cluster archaeon GoMg1]
MADTDPVIYGIVTDTDGKPISDVTVEVVEKGIQNMTDDNGAFVIENAPVGFLQLLFSKSGFLNNVKFINTQPDESYFLSQDMVRLGSTIKACTKGGAFAGPEGMIFEFPPGAIAKETTFTVTSLPLQTIPPEKTGIFFPVLFAFDIQPNVELYKNVSIRIPLDKELVSFFDISEGDVLVLSTYDLSAINLWGLGSYDYFSK